MSRARLQKEFGEHHLIEFIGCERSILLNKDTVEQIFLKAAKKCGATIISHHFHQFFPHGVSGVILIAESHFTIHTWPEESYAAVDIFTCGKSMKPEIAIMILEEAFKADRVVTNVHSRGY